MTSDTCSEQNTYSSVDQVAMTKGKHKSNFNSNLIVDQKIMSKKKQKKLSKSARSAELLKQTGGGGGERERGVHCSGVL